MTISLLPIPTAPVIGAYQHRSFSDIKLYGRMVEAETLLATVEATADGKINCYIQNSDTTGVPTPTPIDKSTGDLWIDSFANHAAYYKNNVFRFRSATSETIAGYVYNSGTETWGTYATNHSITTAQYIWEDIADDGIAEALSDAATAQATADSKITTWYEDAVEDITEQSDGDLWIDMSTSKQNMFRYKVNFTGTLTGYYNDSGWSGYVVDQAVVGKNVWIDIDDIKIFQKQSYVTVSTDSEEGDYTTILAAVTALSTAGGEIYIKNGTYAEDFLDIPDVNLKFIGESKEGVIIDSTGRSSHCFDTSGTSFETTISFYNLTISPHSSYSAVYHYNSTTNLGNLSFEKCIIDGGYRSLYISGIDTFSFTDSVILDSTYRSIYIHYYSKATIIGNTFDGGVTIIDEYASSDAVQMFFQRNVLKEFTGFGYVSDTVAIGYKVVKNNEFYLKANDTSVNSGGINLLARRGEVSYNTVVIQDTSVLTAGRRAYGINAVGGSSYASLSVIFNTIRITTGSTYSTSLTCNGLQVTIDNSNISGNTIVMDLTRYAGYTLEAKGIAIISNSDANLVSQNQIVMGSDVNDIGIYGDATSDDNIVSQNILASCGTDVSLNGTDNVELNNKSL